MKLITLTFFTFIRAVLLYLLLTLPVADKPKIYFLSLVSAFVLGVAAWVVFMGLSYIIRICKASVMLSNALLYLAVFVAVLIAYSTLLAYAVKGMHFWDIDIVTLYPIAAIVAGWLSIYINRKKLNNYLRPVKRMQLQAFALRPSNFDLN